MARAKVVDFDYYQFRPLLQRAIDEGARLEPSDGARWDAFIRERDINLVAASAIAQQKYPSALPVALVEGRETDGLYFVARDEEGCLRLVSIE